MDARWLRRTGLHGAALACIGFTGACAVQSTDKCFDVVHQVAPRPERAIEGHPLDPADYETYVGWGAEWFRGETFGDERAVTDVAGLMNGVVEAPCEKGPPGCTRTVRVFDVFVHALDALDGVEGNLFTGNGGPQGKGYTSDLVLRFPPGSKLFGAIPVPEQLHTGLDVEAGEPFPLGIVAVVAPDADQGLDYLPVASKLGVGPGPEEWPDKRFRVGLTCALCHYSLDVDGDGTADLKSARLGHATPGSPWRPEHAWALGNQDLHFGWLFSLTANPLLGATVISGPVGTNAPADAVAFVRWVRDNYLRAPQAAMRQVAIGMLMQPRGLADDTPDALHDPVNMPSIFTQQNWPYNSDGALENASDRNNGVWTAALDFTGLIGLAGDRASARAGTLYWERPSIYSQLPAATFADMMTRYSPAVRANDILGFSDGVPGLLDPDAVVVMLGTSGVVPKDVFDHAPASRRRTPEDYGGDAPARVGVMALLGSRVRTPPALRAAIHLPQIVAKYHVSEDEFFTDVVSLMLDWQQPPPNVSPMLTGQWPLVERGYGVFREEGCDACHAGAFLTDNRIHRYAATERDESGISPPSTAGWMLPARDLGPALGTDALRTLGTRPQELFVSPSFDPATGRATATGSIWKGLFGDTRVGYKTATLRNLWATPPYLHDGSVGVGFPPGVTPAVDLRARLREAVDDPRLVYGMGPILEAFEQRQSGWHRPDAALSLQALLLESERRKIVASNRAPTTHVPAGAVWDARGEPTTERVPMTTLGVSGIGHEFWVRDVPGGDRVSALVAFLLALDDKPCELPGEPSHCSP